MCPSPWHLGIDIQTASMPIKPRTWGPSATGALALCVAHHSIPMGRATVSGLTLDVERGGALVHVQHVRASADIDSSVLGPHTTQCQDPIEVHSACRQCPMVLPCPHQGVGRRLGGTEEGRPEATGMGTWQGTCPAVHPRGEVGTRDVPQSGVKAQGGLGSPYVWVLVIVREKSSVNFPKLLKRKQKKKELTTKSNI